jgi:predicted ATP-dependent protease
VKADFHKVADEIVQIRFEEMPSAPVRSKGALLSELHTCVCDDDLGAVGIYGIARVGKIASLKVAAEGGNAFESGLIVKTNRGILYVDEVNLLDDHLVDVLLDSAAPAWNTVERKGIFISHTVRFILIPL